MNPLEWVVSFSNSLFIRSRTSSSLTGLPFCSYAMMYFSMASSPSLALPSSSTSGGFYSKNLARQNSLSIMLSMLMSTRLYFLAIALARVVLPDLGLPMMRSCRGTILAYSRISQLKGLGLSRLIFYQIDKLFSSWVLIFLSYSWISRREVCASLMLACSLASSWNLARFLLIDRPRLATSASKSFSSFLTVSLPEIPKRFSFLRMMSFQRVSSSQSMLNSSRSKNSDKMLKYFDYPDVSYLSF